MENKEILRSLCEMSPANYTRADREFIRKLSAEMGVEFKPRKGCPNCYNDQAILLLSILKAKESGSGQRYKLKPGLDFRWKGERINDETLTDELAERLLAEGLPVILFEKTK